ncbi:hypothetical protein J6590_010422 [Homalodisca vitripennis]|nr:hypothetical protein J6590_010422 [Homalodisca vitripennis]
MDRLWVTTCFCRQFAHNNWPDGGDMGDVGWSRSVLEPRTVGDFLHAPIPANVQAAGGWHPNSLPPSSVL